MHYAAVQLCKTSVVVDKARRQIWSSLAPHRIRLSPCLHTARLNRQASECPVDEPYLPAWEDATFAG